MMVSYIVADTAVCLIRSASAQMPQRGLVHPLLSLSSHLWSIFSVIRFIVLSIKCQVMREALHKLQGDIQLSRTQILFIMKQKTTRNKQKIFIFEVHVNTLYNDSDMTFPFIRAWDWQLGIHVHPHWLGSNPQGLMGAPM